MQLHLAASLSLSDALVPPCAETPSAPKSCQKQVRCYKSIVQLFAPSSRSTSKCSPLWRHFLWLLVLNACGSILSIVAWVARYQQKVFSFASKEAKKGSAEYWSGQV
jgi:hypothetical protein